jgi:hypothetical protein
MSRSFLPQHGPTELAAFPVPEPQESLSSWVERIGMFYGTEYEPWLASLLSRAGRFPSPARHDVDCDREFRAHLLRATNLQEHDVPMVLDASSANVLHLSARSAFCPLCWDDDVASGRQPFVRRSWAFWHRIICRQHKTFLSARRRVGLRESQGSPSWTPVWRTRKSWARFLDISHDRGGLEAAVSYSPGRYTKLSLAELADFEAEIDRIGVEDDVSVASTEFNECPARQAQQALDLVMTEGFLVVMQDVRRAILGIKGQANLSASKFDGVRYSGVSHRPQLLENRMSALVTASEVLRFMEMREPISEYISRALFISVGLHRTLDNPDTGRHVSTWPTSERENFLKLWSPTRLSRHSS